MTEFVASDWITKEIKDIFRKTITVKIRPNSARDTGQPWVAKMRWYAHNQTYGTNEEQPFRRIFPA